MSPGAPRARSPFLVALVGLGLALLPPLAGCGGGPPRKPTPKGERDDSVRREKFTIPGVRDEWHEAPALVRGLKQLGGVVDVHRDESDGKFVVIYSPIRVTRDDLRLKIIEIGREQGREFDPLFDDR